MVCRPPLRCLSQQNDGEEEEGSSTVKITYLSLGGDFFFFILEFVLDFRNDNLMILVIRSLFPYQRPILLDFWEDNLMILEIKYLFPYQREILPC